MRVKLNKRKSTVVLLGVCLLLTHHFAFAENYLSIQRAVEVLNRLRATEQITLSVRGKGIAAGEALDISLTNHTSERLLIRLPAGTVFKPSDPSVQKMIVGESCTLECEPYGKEETTLYVYCLEKGKAPPPEPEEGGEEITWSLSTNFEYCEKNATIISTGNELSERGDYEQKFKSKKSYKKEVIQWALWVENSEKEISIETLREELNTQLAEFPEEQQPSEKEKEEVVQTIWGDIDLTLKKSRTKWNEIDLTRKKKKDPRKEGDKPQPKPSPTPSETPGQPERGKGTVIGTIVCDHHGPVPGVEVHMFECCTNSQEFVFSNDKGQFVIHNVDPGTHNLRFFPDSAHLHRIADMSVAVRANQITRVTITPLICDHPVEDDKK